MRNFSKTILGILVFILLLGVTNVNAKKIIIEEDDNPDGIVIMSLGDVSYYIDVDEETQFGYVVRTMNGNDVVLGTCAVVVINAENPNGYVLCLENEDSLGTLTIVITNELTREGHIEILTGELTNLFEIDTEVVIEE